MRTLALAAARCGACRGAGASPARAAAQNLPPAATAPFDFYVMTLSWSPGFCDLGGDEKSPSNARPAPGTASSSTACGRTTRDGPNPEDCNPDDDVSARRSRGRARPLPDRGPRALRIPQARHLHRPRAPRTISPRCAMCATSSSIPRHAAGAARDAAPVAAGDRAGLHRRQRQSERRRTWRSPARAASSSTCALPVEGPQRFRHCPKVAGHTCHALLDRRRAAALSGARRCASGGRDELPPRLPRRQFRRRLQARDPGAHPRLSRAQGRAVPLHRHARRRRPLRSRERRGASARRNGATASRGCSRPSPPAAVAALLAPYLRAIGPLRRERARPPPTRARRRSRRRSCARRTASRSARRIPRSASAGRRARTRRPAQHRRHRRLCRAQRLSAAEGAARPRPDRPAVRGAGRDRSASSRRSRARSANGRRGVYLALAADPEAAADARFLNAVAALGAPNILRLELDVGAGSGRRACAAPLRAHRPPRRQPAVQAVRRGPHPHALARPTLAREGKGRMSCDWLTPPRRSGGALAARGADRFMCEQIDEARVSMALPNVLRGQAAPARHRLAAVHHLASGAGDRPVQGRDRRRVSRR